MEEKNVVENVESSHPALSEAEELLLLRYIDGECGFFAKRKAKKLLSREQDARNFIDQIDKSSSVYRLSKSGMNMNVDLWDKINTRIDQEEHAAIFLGERNSVVEESPSWFARLTWGLSGAVVTASLVVLAVAIPREETIDSPELALGEGSRPVVDLASSGVAVKGVAVNAPVTRPVANVAASRPRIIEPIYPNSLEVDWMRSHGRVMVQQLPKSDSAIIWVNRRKRPNGKALEHAFPKPIPSAIPARIR